MVEFIHMANGSEGFDTKPLETQEISDKQLSWGYWFLTNKEKFFQARNLSLIIFSFLTLGYALVSTAYYFIFQYQDYQVALQTLENDLVNYSGIRANSQIIDLEVISRELISKPNGRLDAVARVRNSNQKWAVSSLSYQFIVGGQPIEPREAFILPGEEKYIYALNLEQAGTGTPQLLIDDIKWRRIRTDYAVEAERRLDFTIEDENLTTAQEGDISNRLSISELTASITNNSAYNYETVEVQVALQSGTRTVGFNVVTLQNFRTDQTQPITSRWTQNFPAITNIQIIPTVNIIDPEVYLEIEAGQIIL